MRNSIAAVIAALAVSITPLAAQSIDLTYEKFTLDNGLRVVIHEDRKAPIVAVSIWYHVGSKDEPEGKTGFAHLFEHLMFNGSENYDGEWFLPLSEVGATDTNGTTWFDRTNYFQTVPTPALERILWMESDRMGHLLGAVTQEKLDNQRGVVQNEKRQGDNQPYGLSEYRVLEGLFPAAHPYRHSTIGSMADLDAASLDDVKDWFKRYYGAANTVLVLAGDIDATTAKPLIEKYFGDIEAGPPLNQMTANAPMLTESKHEIMYDRVPQARIDRNWIAPGRTTKDSQLLYLAATVLGSGKTSRLYQALVFDQELATSASASLQEQEILSFLSTTADAKEGVDPDVLTASMEAVIEKFLAKGPTRDELKRAKTRINASVIRGLEKVGGFSGKAANLAEGEIYAGQPDFIETQLKWINEATPAQVVSVARKYMRAGHYQLDVLPFPEYSAAANGVDRSGGLPAAPTSSPDLDFPDIEEATLSNGMKIALATRTAVPIVGIDIQFDAGYAADQGAKLGASSFTMAMLDEGAAGKSALQIAQTLESLGASLGAGSNLDMSSVSISALKANLQPSIALMANIVRQPTFADDDIEKLRKRWLAQIQQEKANPVQLALRLLPPLMYGEDHAYSVPFTGSGTEASIKSLTRADLQNYHQNWLRPDNATIFVAGDVTMAEIKPQLEKAFGNWRSTGEIPAKNVSEVALPERGKVILIDKPGSPQSLILAGHLAPSSTSQDNITISAMNDVLGGQFTARVNMNLREEKGWAYGAYTFMQGARGQRPWMVYAPVQTDRTSDSIKELLKEFSAYLGDRPAEQDELERVVASNTKSLPGDFETADDVLGSLTSSNRYGRPYDYPESLKAKYEALSIDELAKSAGQVIHPESLIWVIVGDREKIESDIRALDLGELEVRSISDL